MDAAGWSDTGSVGLLIIERSERLMLRLADPRDVARDRLRDDLFAVGIYLSPARKRAVHRVECKWLQDLRHALNLGGGERDEVWIGPHKADVPARDDLEDVA